jgi:uncharacterized membrane protein
MRLRRDVPTWAAALASCVLLAVSFFVLQWLEHGHVGDVHHYVHYARLVRHGALPYRDFGYVYPPASLPVILLPAYLPWSYPTAFAVVMGVCGVACVAAAVRALRSVGAGPVRTTGALLLLGVSPLALGEVFNTRFDLWPTLLALAAIVVLLRERSLLAGGLTGLGFAAKLWPGVLLPLAVVYLWRRASRGAALRAVLSFIAVVAACFVPFAILAPHGLAASLKFQVVRPLQVESLGAAVLMALRHLRLTSALVTVSRPTGQSLKGAGTGLAADLSSAFDVAAVVGVWVAFALRRRGDRDSLLLAAAASVSALVAFDKVLSPQYLIWLVPFVALVRGKRGVAAGLLLLVGLGLTQTWFPWNYLRLAFGHDSPWSWLLLARDLVLVGLAAALAWPRPEREEAEQLARFDGLAAIPARAE